ncbi:Variable outer membrane protein (plasmid) [Borrelia hermsii YBT]|uniref:Variable outer membrane protein n=1 Tax=Borrelia hermsii YBT TaxID=1313295 RepID=W5T1S0_BORHE|nr:hypothetical protein [Borrelia hermsii]AHH13127.1 Variable outer membrane protein [Borrelia hermsii YBT]
MFRVIKKQKDCLPLNTAIVALLRADNKVVEAAIKEFTTLLSQRFLLSS